MTRIPRTAALAAFAALAFAATVASAQAETRHFKVSYADLDLSQAADVTTMVDRLSNALNTVCGRMLDYSTGMRRGIAKCRTEAVRDVIQQIGAPLLTARLDGARTYTLTSR